MNMPTHCVLLLGFRKNEEKFNGKTIKSENCSIGIVHS